jgi:hypothetical protein
MSEWRTTRSGYRFEVITKAEMAAKIAEDSRIWECPHEGCPVLIQGGVEGYRAHMDQIHPGEERPVPG